MRKLWGSSRVKLVVMGLLVAALLMSLSPIDINISSPLTSNQIDLKIGYVRVAMASGTMDYPLTQVGIQDALNALPATGGRLNIMSTAATVTFAGTVSRAIPNVTIQGTGNVPLIQNNGVVPLFSVGGQTGWVFRDLSTDAGGITLATDTVLDNVHLGTAYYALRTTGSYPTGRGATYVIAASDATDLEKAQADQILTGTNDQVAINAALVTLSALGTRPKLLLAGNFTCNGAVVPQSNVDVDIQGSIVITMTSATIGITFNSITNSIWSGGTIIRAGTINPVGLANTISFTGTSGETLILQNMTIGSTIIDATTEQNGAIRHLAGNPILRNLNVYASIGATGPVAGGLLLGGFGTKPLIDGGIYKGGGGNQNSGIFAQDGTNAVINNVIAMGNPDIAVQESDGIISWDMASPIINNATAFGGNGTSYSFGANLAGGAGIPIINGGTFYGGINNGGIQNIGIRIANSNAAIITGAVMKPQESSQWFRYLSANNGRFIPFSGYRYQLRTMYIYEWGAGNGAVTYDIGTSVGGNEIADNVGGNNSIYFTLVTRPNIAASGYMYVTPSAGVADDSFFIGYTVAYDSGLQVGLLIDTYGAASISNSSIYGTRNGFGVELGANSLSAKKFSVSDSHIENYNIDGSGNAIAVYSDSGSFPNAPFFNCTILGNPPTYSVPYFNGSTTTSPIFTLSSEIKIVTGTLTSGVTNAIAFSWQNPDKQDVLITKVVVEITTAGGTATSVIQVGLATDTVGTGLGTEFFTTIDANAVAVRDSYLATDNGTQTKFVKIIRILAGGNTCIVGKILTANASNLTGRYYIYYTGRQ